MAVAPSLTPDGYNSTFVVAAVFAVVVPSLTPDGYNREDKMNHIRKVVVPSLTPDGYNSAPGDTMAFLL